MKRIQMLAILLMVGACTQNPFPNGRLTQREPIKPPPVSPALVIEAPTSLEVLEGQKVEIQLKVNVPVPGKPLIVIHGMSKGAVFDLPTLKFTWTPDFQAANDPNDDKVTSRNYVINYQLSSTEDPVTIRQAWTVITVRDFSHPLVMNLPPAPAVLYEGKPFEQYIQVSSQDYPTGPFELSIKDLPVGAQIARDLRDPTRFKVSFTPSYREVDITKVFTWGAYVDRKLIVTAFGPRGINTTSEMIWRITDVRQKANLIVPSAVTQGTSVSFTVTAEDTNGEEAPTLTYVKPSFGLTDFKEDRSSPGDASRGMNPSTTATFRWVQIPPEKIGTTQPVVFRACVKKSRWDKTLCTDETVKVTFQAETHKAPLVDRKSFPLGTVNYVREQQKLSFSIGIRDGEFSNTPPTVVLASPNSEAGEITWKNGQIIVEGKKAGLKQFSLTATSAYGVTQTESFLLEVLPWSWSSVILFGDGPTNAEVRASSALFESAQVANPALQLTDPRLLVQRDTVYITTSAFQDQTVVGPMERLASRVGNAILSTPLLQKLEDNFQLELSRKDIQLGPRITDLTGYSLELAPGSGLTNPSNPIRLSGKLTSESASPLRVNYVGRGRTPVCKPLLVLRKVGETDVPVALSCDRGKGNVLIVAGIEWGDIQTSPSDSRLVKKWLTDLVGK